ncbi:hypothetical protein Vretifemale_12225, partial [Volvox reticuliferus]
LVAAAAAAQPSPSLPHASTTDEEFDATSCRSSEALSCKSTGVASVSSSAVVDSTAGGAGSSSCTAIGAGSGSSDAAGSLLPPPPAVDLPMVAPGGAAVTACGDPAAAVQCNVNCTLSLPLHWTWSPGTSYAGSCAGGRDGHHRMSATGAQLGGGGGLHDSVSYGLASGAAGVASLAAALTGGSDPASCLPLLRGKKILLVEPCIMVRQVLMLALRSWGCRVCAVASSYDAVRRLVESGTLAEAMAPPRRPEPPRRPCMILRHAEVGSELDPNLYNTQGPYDCVIMDMKDTALLRALTRADDREAQRLVLMGWPGQNEPEEDEDGLEAPGLGTDLDLDLEHGYHAATAAAAAAAEDGVLPPMRPYQQRYEDAPGVASDGANVVGGIVAAAPPPPLGPLRPPGPYDFTETMPADVTARPPRAVTEEMSKPQNRQLGYVTVTRPVRQGRLKLALEEVLMMQLDGGTSHHQHCWSDDGEDDTARVAAAAPLAPLPRVPYASDVVTAAGTNSRCSLEISAFLEDATPPPTFLEDAPPLAAAAAAAAAAPSFRLPLTRSGSSSLRLCPPTQSSPPNPHPGQQQQQQQQQSQSQQTQRRYFALEGTIDMSHRPQVSMPAAIGPSGESGGGG